MAFDSKSYAMKLLGDFFHSVPSPQCGLRMTLRVRYHDKAVVVGVVITAVLGASAGQLHYTVGEIAQIGERY